jgi:hypothetical protein
MLGRSALKGCELNGGLPCMRRVLIVAFTALVCLGIYKLGISAYHQQAETAQRDAMLYQAKLLVSQSLHSPDFTNLATHTRTFEEGNDTLHITAHYNIIGALTHVSWDASISGIPYSRHFELGDILSEKATITYFNGTWLKKGVRVKAKKSKSWATEVNWRLTMDFLSTIRQLSSVRTVRLPEPLAAPAQTEQEELDVHDDLVLDLPVQKRTALPRLLPH